ncbi:hypothetical protein E8E15_009576 [Penicillium rubens]|nr:hypothetical protein E8E15_009576 [Penicillium rubens]
MAYAKKIHKVAEDVRVLGRFGGKRASTLVSNAVRIMTSEQTERLFQVYQNFLCDIRTASGPLGRNMVVLCSATIGKTKAITLNETDRIKLVQYIATTSIRLDSEHLSSLAAQYNIPSTDNWSLGGVHLSQTDNPGGNNEPQKQLTHSLGGLDPQTGPSSQELNENNVLNVQAHPVHGTMKVKREEGPVGNGPRGFSNASVAVVLAYSKYGAGEFGYAPIHQGKCSVAKNSATGIHLVINILSTIMLGASNYCMQCLAAPSRSEVDEAHQKRAWLAIGTPDIAHLVFACAGQEKVVGYNAAAYYLMQPQKYGVSVFHDIRALESLESTHLKLGYGACFDKYTGMNASELQHVIRYERYERLNKKDCIDRFAQDYLLGQKAVLVMTNISLPSDVPLVYAGSGNHALDFTSSTLRDNMDDLAVEAYHWFPVQLLDDLDGFHLRKRADTESEGNVECTAAAATMEMQLPTFTVDHCLNIPAEESCQLVFLPAVCLVVFCNIIKLVCMVPTARDDREEVFLNIGDAIASFLTRPDPATESAGLLSKDAVKKGTQGWHKTSLIYSPIPPTEFPLPHPNIYHRASAGHKPSANPAGSGQSPSLFSF